MRKTQAGLFARGFTLVELLVVIAIIGVLVALLLPAVQAAREAARRNSCANNLKQMGLALQNHIDVRKVLPMGRNEKNQFAVSWAFQLLPYVEEDNVYKAWQKSLRVDDQANARAMRVALPVYACPSRRPAAADRDFDNNDDPPADDKRGVATLGDYAASSGFSIDNEATDGQLPNPAESGPIYTLSKVRDREIVDGLSNTFAIGEKYKPEHPENEESEQDRLQHAQGDTAFLAGDNPQTIFAEPDEGIAQDPSEDDNDMFGSEHPSMAQFVFLDGRVKNIQASIEKDILARLGCIGDEQPIPEGTF